MRDHRMNLAVRSAAAFAAATFVALSLAGAPAAADDIEALSAVDPADDAIESVTDANSAPAADAGAESETISYIERGWDGSSVTEKTVTESAMPLPGDPGAIDWCAPGVAEGTVDVSPLFEEGTYFAREGEQKTYNGRAIVTGNVKLVLPKGCVVVFNDGIYVEKGATLSIYGGDGDGLGGKLIANVKHGAAIGAYSGHKGGDVIVHGGELEVTGGEQCAAIGSNNGDGTNVGSFVMYGGKVTATGGEDGAAIGGGKDSEGHVTIYGGEVNAVAGSDGAAIGGGENSDGGTVSICGGDVTATGSSNGAAIGGGSNGDGGTIIISGGKVQVYHRDGAGIGGAEDGDGGRINISGGEVHSDYLGQGNGAGIGGGNHGGDGGSVTISGGNVTSTSNHGAGIGGGRADDTLGASNSGEGGSIGITGGTVHATANHGYGIGAGDGSADQNPYDLSWVSYAGDIAVSGTADVTATGYKAGIGGEGGTLTIDRASVVARGGEGKKGGCGIRFSYGQEAGNSSRAISAGKVTVCSGKLLAEALGGTYVNGRVCGIDCARLTIVGGQVEVNAIDEGLSAVSVVKGDGGVLHVSSEKAEAVERLVNDGTPHVTVEDGAEFESRSAKLVEPLLYKVGQGLAFKAGRTKDEASGRSVGSDGRVTGGKDCLYTYIGPAAK